MHIRITCKKCQGKVIYEIKRIKRLFGFIIVPLYNSSDINAFPVIHRFVLTLNQIINGGFTTDI